MDKTKGLVARKIQTAILDIDWDAAVPHSIEGSVRLGPNKATAHSSLITSLTIRTEAGPRQFIIKVSETL